MDPLNPAFAEEVARSFALQPIMNLIGARPSVEPGVVEITLPNGADLAQQEGSDSESHGLSAHQAAQPLR